MALTDARGRVVELKLVEGQSYEGSHVVGMLPLGMELIIVGDKGFDVIVSARAFRDLLDESSTPRWARALTITNHLNFAEIPSPPFHLDGLDVSGPPHRILKPETVVKMPVIIE